MCVCVCVYVCVCTWSADSGFDAGLLQCWDSVDGPLYVLHEHVPVQIKQAKGKLIRHLQGHITAVSTPRHTHTQTYTHTNIQRLTYMYNKPYTQLCTKRCTHTTHMHTHTHTHTHTIPYTEHTHTHTHTMTLYEIRLQYLTTFQRNRRHLFNMDTKYGLNVKT